MNGFLVIDKPGGMTSRDVVNRIQKWFPRKTKIGHTGTLDPLATGVLVVCVGAATRLADYVQAMGKTYVSRFRLGATSTTDDADGVIAERDIAELPSRARIESLRPALTGNVEQVPPAFSALKFEGHRAHDLARKGESVKLSARTVRIDEIRLLHYEWPFLDVEVECGKGTYIRSIARDLGEKLGCGGLVQTLRRTRIGPFTAEQGIPLDFDPCRVTLLPLSAALGGMPTIRFNPDEVKRFRTGQMIQTPNGQGEPVEIAVQNEVGELIAIGLRTNGAIKPMIVFAL